MLGIEDFSVVGSVSAVFFFSFPILVYWFYLSDGFGCGGFSNRRILSDGLLALLLFRGLGCCANLRGAVLDPWGRFACLCVCVWVWRGFRVKLRVGKRVNRLRNMT